MILSFRRGDWRVREPIVDPGDGRARPLLLQRAQLQLYRFPRRPRHQRQRMVRLIYGSRSDLKLCPRPTSAEKEIDFMQIGSVSLRSYSGDLVAG